MNLDAIIRMNVVTIDHGIFEINTIKKVDSVFD